MRRRPIMTDDNENDDDQNEKKRMREDDFDILKELKQNKIIERFYQDGAKTQAHATT